MNIHQSKVSLLYVQYLLSEASILLIISMEEKLFIKSGHQTQAAVSLNSFYPLQYVNRRINNSLTRIYLLLYSFFRLYQRQKSSSKDLLKNVCTLWIDRWNIIWKNNCYYKDDIYLSCSRWFCHFDDDNYVNIPRLVRFLGDYNPREDWYLGKPSIQAPLEIINKDKSSVSVLIWATAI